MRHLVLFYAFDSRSRRGQPDFRIFSKSVILLKCTYAVKISLNGEVKRILSLADVQVFGDSFEFNFDLGREFNIPRTNVNRIAFIQDDDGDGKQGQSKFSRITFMKNEVKEISVS